MLLERAEYKTDSPIHSIEEGMLYNSKFCCKSNDNIWEIDEIAPPCEICPNNVVLTERNYLAFSAFRDLDQTGRDVGFDVGHIREEAIDVYLNRFSCNTPEVYDALVLIDREVTAHRRKKSEEDRKRKEKRQQPKSNPRTRRGRR